MATTAATAKKESKDVKQYTFSGREGQAAKIVKGEVCAAAIPSLSPRSAVGRPGPERQEGVGAWWREDHGQGYSPSSRGSSR